MADLALASHGVADAQDDRTALWSARSDVTWSACGFLLCRAAKEVVIPNGVVCREESAVAGSVPAAGKKQIPPLRVRNDNTFAGRTWNERDFGARGFGDAAFR